MGIESVVSLDWMETEDSTSQDEQRQGEVKKLRGWKGLILTRMMIAKIVENT